ARAGAPNPREGGWAQGARRAGWGSGEGGGQGLAQRGRLALRAGLCPRSRITRDRTVVVMRDGKRLEAGGSRSAKQRDVHSIRREGPPLAASRTSATALYAHPSAPRLSFARISGPLEVPDLLGLQTESFDWLLGNEKWQARVAAAAEAGRNDVPEKSGLEE